MDASVLSSVTTDSSTCHTHMLQVKRKPRRLQLETSVLGCDVIYREPITHGTSRDTTVVPVGLEPTPFEL